MGPRDIMQEFDGTSPTAENNGSPEEMKSAFAVDVHRAMPLAKAPSDVEDGLPTLTKAELANLLLEQVGLNKREAKDLVESFFAEINSALEGGESVKLTGFGNFQLRDKVSRPGRNPKTGVEVQIPARRVVTFQASQKLKDMVDTRSSEGQVDEIFRS